MSLGSPVFFFRRIKSAFFAINVLVIAFTIFKNFKRTRHVSNTKDKRGVSVVQSLVSQIPCPQSIKDPRIKFWDLRRTFCHSTIDRRYASRLPRSIQSYRGASRYVYGTVSVSTLADQIYVRSDHQCTLILCRKCR